MTNREQIEQQVHKIVYEAADDASMLWTREMERGYESKILALIRQAHAEGERKGRKAALRELTNEMRQHGRYWHRHKHDIQVGFRKDDKYSCGICGRTLEEIQGNDGLGYCAYADGSRSANHKWEKAIAALEGQDEMNLKIKQGMWK